MARTEIARASSFDVDRKFNWGKVMTTLALDHLAILDGSIDQLQIAQDHEHTDPLGMTESQRIMDAVLRECFASEPGRDRLSLDRETSEVLTLLDWTSCYSPRSMARVMALKPPDENGFRSNGEPASYADLVITSAKLCQPVDMPSTRSVGSIAA
jgi:hypothetical protein